MHINLLSAITGSVSYNLNIDTSDVDRRGVYLDPKEATMGLEASPTQHVGEDNNDTMYSFKHFMMLLAKGNPNIVELLYLRPEHYEVLHWSFKNIIIGNRDRLMSRYSVESYLGYVGHQLKIVQKDIRPAHSHNGMDCKAAMHIFRLLLQLEELITKGTLTPFVSDDTRAHLLRIRSGEAFASFADMYAEVRAVESDIRALLPSSPLPERIDRHFVNGLMIQLFEECYYAEPDVRRKDVQW